MSNQETLESLVSQNSVLKYPDPFFDLSRNFLPSNIKKLFKWCRTFFYTNEFIRNVITKLTEYPITDIIFSNEIDNETEQSYRKFFDKNIKLKKMLIEIGLDYYTYGNSFISAQIKFKRSLKCGHCKEENPIENVSFKYKKSQFLGICPSCKKEDVVFIPKDIYLKNVDGLVFTRWSPENIDIVYNHITGESRYYYNIPTELKKGIIRGNVDIVATMPLEFLDAAEQNKKIKLDNNNLYHFKRPTLAEDDMGWGKPVILPALKKLYYMQTLLRANEAI